MPQISTIIIVIDFNNRWHQSMETWFKGWWEDHPSWGMPLQRKFDNENIIHISDKQNVQAGGVWCPSIRDKDQGEAGRSTTFLAWHKLTLWWKEGHNKLRIEMRSSYSVELLDIYHIPSLALIDASVKGHLKILGGFFEVIITINIQRNPLKFLSDL